MGKFALRLSNPDPTDNWTPEERGAHFKRCAKIVADHSAELQPWRITEGAVFAAFGGLVAGPLGAAVGAGLGYGFHFLGEKLTPEDYAKRFPEYSEERPKIVRHHKQAAPTGVTMD